MPEPVHSSIRCGSSCGRLLAGWQADVALAVLLGTVPETHSLRFNDTYNDAGARIDQHNLLSHPDEHHRAHLRHGACNRIGQRVQGGQRKYCRDLRAHARNVCMRRRAKTAFITQGFQDGATLGGGHPHP